LVARGHSITWLDVEPMDSQAAGVRLEMEALFAREWGLADAGAFTG
jgi:hypothetical protein